MNYLLMPILTNSKEFIQNEFSRLNLGDERLNRRVLDVAAAMNAGPSFSIPSMANGNMAQLKAIYRFFRNKKINHQNILESHYLNTIERMEAYNGKILLLNDSCFVTPTKSFKGLMTRGKGKENCVRTHYCLAVSEDGIHIFGILSFHVLTDPITDRYPDLRDESDIWIITAENCIELINSSSQGKKLLSRCLFVADREGDEFELLTFLIKNDLGFIIRSQYERVSITKEAKGKLNELEHTAKKHGKPYVVKTRIKNIVKEVEVERSVLQNVAIMPPAGLKKEHGPIDVNVVLVKDVDNEEPEVKWRLFTSESVNKLSDSAFIVTCYSHRWKIEEVNKGAKTGVGAEKRQFTDADHFIPFLAMAFVVGWRLVALRTVVETAPDTPIEEAFTDDEVFYMKTQAEEFELDMETVKDGLYLIARLGGFTGSYARPGWQILWQGWIKFYERVLGFSLARKTFSG